MRRSDDPRLPVPAPWQPAVARAIDELAASLGLPCGAVVPTRVEEAAWVSPDTGATEEGLDIWLLARGRTHRFRAILSDPTAPDVFAATGSAGR